MVIFHSFLETFTGGYQISTISIANQPDALQKMTNSLLVNVGIPINTKRLED